MKTKKKLAKVAKPKKKRSDTATPIYNEDGDWEVVVKRHHKFVTLPITEYERLIDDSNDLRRMKEILGVEEK